MANEQHHEQPRILGELLDSLEGQLRGRAAPGVRAIHRPPGGSAEPTSPFTVVELDSEPMAMGLSYNLLEDGSARARYDALDLHALAGEGDALSLARRVLGSDPAQRVVGYAACHALSQLLLRDGAAGEGLRETERDLAEVLEPGPADHVGMVGHTPRMVRRFEAAGAGTITVLERRGREPDAAEACGAAVTTAPAELAACNKVLITSTTLLNDTFDAIERATRGAALRALYGPGAGVLPHALFGRGIDAVGGMVVTNPAELVRRQLAGERWGDARRKVVWLRA